MFTSPAEYQLSVEDANQRMQEMQNVLKAYNDFFESAIFDDSTLEAFLEKLPNKSVNTEFYEQLRDLIRSGDKFARHTLHKECVDKIHNLISFYQTHIDDSKTSIENFEK